MVDNSVKIQSFQEIILRSRINKSLDNIILKDIVWMYIDELIELKLKEKKE